MNALIMCGGRGTRLRPEIEGEKPLVEVDGRPMIERVLAALDASQVASVYAAVSPATPRTADWLATQQSVTCIETAGDGYVADLTDALDSVDSPVVTVTADLPLLHSQHVDRAIAAADGESLAVCVPLSVVTKLGTSAETTINHEGSTVVPTGLNVVGSRRDRRVVWDDTRLAINGNYPSDLQLAEQCLRANK